jgi:DsbC/DsbD-like thiol-disulfide interchange protein
MFNLSRLIKFLPVLALLGPDWSHAGDASSWAEGHQSRVRLVAGGTAGAAHLAGVEIVLDGGFKTYWRNPGEAGLPPAFDWSASANVETVEVLWPAPSRFADSGGVTYGYQGQVLFPLRVRPKDPAKPVSLGLKIDYGVCKDICIPAKAELSLPLPRDGSPTFRAAIESALQRIPRPHPYKADGELSIRAARIMGDHKSKLMVTVEAPPGSKPLLFVEGPDNWFFEPTPEATQIEPGEKRKTFHIDILERPPEGGRIDLRFTLVAGDKAIETTTSLDAARLER